MGKFLSVLVAASNDAAGAGARKELTMLFMAIAASVWAILGFQFAANRCGVWLSSHVSLAIRTQLHRAILDMRFDHRSTLDAGTLQARVGADASAIEGLFAVALPTIAIQLIFVMGASALLIARAPFLAPLVAAPIAILVVALLLLRRITAALIAQSASLTAEIAARVAEIGNGARAIRLFGREAHQQQLFTHAAQQSATVSRKLWTYNGGFQHALILNVSLCSYLLWYVGGLNALQPHAPLGASDLIALVPIVLLLFQPVYSLASMLDSIPKALAAAERIAVLLDAPLEPAFGVQAVPNGGTLAFERVAFGYGKGADVLHDCSFSVRRGEFVALTGASGAGKSTIVHLIARLYEPRAGTLRWGSHDASDVAPQSWRRALGVVAQETFLFAESVRENIRCGRAWISDAAIEAAARVARADEFVGALADGYETMLGDGGVSLSGGERQRIGIARALAGDPALLLFDEPSSALDAQTERAFFDALDRARRGRTTIVVTHRASTIARADRVLVLAQGRVVESPRRSGRAIAS